VVTENTVDMIYAIVSLPVSDRNISKTIVSYFTAVKYSLHSAVKLYYAKDENLPFMCSHV